MKINLTDNEIFELIQERSSDKSPNDEFSSEEIEYIKSVPELAYGYALYILKERWEEAESTILKDEKITWWYINEVLKKPWPEGKKVLTNPILFWYIQKYE